MDVQTSSSRSWCLYSKYLFAALFAVALTIRVAPLLSSVFSNGGWSLLARELVAGGQECVSGECLVWRPISGSEQVLFGLALMLDDGNGAASAGLSLLAGGQGDENQAKQWALESIASGRRQLTTYFFLGNLAQVAGDQQLALESWRSAQAAPFFFGQAERLSASGQTTDALERYQRAIQIKACKRKSLKRSDILYICTGSP